MSRNTIVAIVFAVIGFAITAAVQWQCGSRVESGEHRSPK